MNKPDIRVEDEEYIFEETKPKGQYVAEPRRPMINTNMGNCCEISKDAWVKKVKELESSINNRYSDTVVQTLDPSHLDCRNFYNLIKELRLMKPGSYADTSVNKIIGRYFRIDKLNTSLLSSVANIAKVAGVAALEAWQYCAEQKEKEPDNNWQNQLRRDYA